MSLVELDLTDHIATVTLDDPDRRNALSGEMVAELCATFDAFEAAVGIRAVVVSGAGTAFCAGADLWGLMAAGASPEEARRGLGGIYEGFLRVARCPLPTVAAVNGPAVGAGMNLALACDLRVAATTARLDPRFLQLDLHPGGGHTWLLQRLVGTPRAKAAVLFGEAFDADDALRTGLVHRVVEPDQLADTARSFAARAARSPRDLLIDVKATMDAMAEVTGIDDAVQRELEPQIRSITRPGVAERLGIVRPDDRGDGAHRR